MTCFIIAAMSADGFIARDPSASSMTWTSKEDKKRFVEITKRAGVVVMGSKTWRTFGKPLKDRLTVVYSRKPVKDLPQGVEYTSKSPNDLLKDLESRGYREAAICGGSQIYTMFMKSGLVNKSYLTVEPVIFGSGIRLFNEEMDFPLTLIDDVKTDRGTLLLEYAVKLGE